MSCISSNFSSFFLNSLNDPSEFSKYLSNGELRFSSFEDFQVYNNSATTPQQYQQQPHYHMNGTMAGADPLNQGGDEGNSNLENTQPSGQQHGHGHQQTHVQQHHPQHGHYGSFHQQNHAGGQNPLMHLQQHQQRWAPGGSGGVGVGVASNHPQQHMPTHGHGLPPPAPQGAAAGVSNGPTPGGAPPQHFDGSFEFMKYLRHSNDYNENPHDAAGQGRQHPHAHHAHPHHTNASASGPTAIGTKPESSLNANNASLIDLDTTPHKVSRSSRKTPAGAANHHANSNSNSSHNHHPPTPMAVDVYDHDSKHMLYDLHHMNSVHSSNSNESSMELSSLTYPNSHLNASNSNTSSEGGNNQGHSDFSMLGVAGGGASASSSTSSSATANGGGGGGGGGASGNSDAAANASPAAPKVLANFTITENFEAHPSHKVEEGIFQHMNKLPTKKKDNLKSLGVRFTGQMTLNDKSIIVENFIRFCQEYDIQDHRPFLSLNQSGLNKPDQIKFARYLGQGLPTFTLFCIYSNFKNLFCTKRTEIYIKDGYNLPYILEKTKSFLANTAAGNNNSNAPTTTTNTTTTTTTTTNTSSSTTTSTSTTVAASSSSTNDSAVSTNSNAATTTTNAPITSTSESSNNSTSSSNSNAKAISDTVAASAAANGALLEPSAVGNVSIVTNGNTTAGQHANGNLNGSAAAITNEVLQTPTKPRPQANMMPSTPLTSQVQHQAAVGQTVGTPLPPGHPAQQQHFVNPQHHGAATSRPQTPTTPHLQQHNNPSLVQQQQQQLQLQTPTTHLHHVVQRPAAASMPMSPMVVVSTANVMPTSIMGSPLPPNGQLQHPQQQQQQSHVGQAQVTANHVHAQHHPQLHHHPIQHTYHPQHPPQHHMQPQPNHLPHPHPSQMPPILPHHHLQHHAAAPHSHNGGGAAATPYTHHQQPPPQQHPQQIQKPSQMHVQQQQPHPMHHIAAPNPPH
uniref:Uncharacterized protein n=1 Tax=Stomoxys calcitrans TaxID=35570 RepID=A0A1I8QAB7_STOCA